MSWIIQLWYVTLGQFILPQNKEENSFYVFLKGSEGKWSASLQCTEKYNERLHWLALPWITSCEWLSLCSWFCSWGADCGLCCAPRPAAPSVGPTIHFTQQRKQPFQFNMKNTSMYLKYIGPTFLFKYHGNIKGKLLHHKTVKTSQMTHFGFWNLKKAKKQRVKAPNLISWAQEARN